MKKQLLFACLTTALLVGCSKNENVDDVTRTHISAKAVGAKSPITRAPLEGTSLSGKKAQVYTTTLPLEAYTGDKSTMFSNAYASGTMTFSKNSYTMYNEEGFGGNMLLPKNKNAVYLYGFYPTGWTINNGATQSLSHTFDGKTDLMATWVTAADQQKIAYEGGLSDDLPERAEFMFHHLLTCYNIRVMSPDIEQAQKWGRVKSVIFKDATINQVTTTENLGYTYGAAGGSVLFYQLNGQSGSSGYSDIPFGATDYDSSISLGTNIIPICYSMASPITVDNDPETYEVVLEVVTMAQNNGKTTTTLVPISLDPMNFASNAYSTRGYTINITLSFGVGIISGAATIEEWSAAPDREDQDVILPEEQP